jgi:hypothetical protein
MALPKLKGSIFFVPHLINQSIKEKEFYHGYRHKLFSKSGIKPDAKRE